MSWTYTGDPANSDIDFVRYKTGDTDTTDQLITDEEILFEISARGSLLGAAYQVTRAILRKLARRVDKKIGPARIALQQQYEQYKDLLSIIESELAEAGQGVPTQSDNLHISRFDIGMMDNH